MKILLYLFGMLAAAMATDYDAESLLREGNRQFTARMYVEVAKQHPDENIIQSAYSVLSPLAQLSLASAGESHDEILKAIGLPNDNVTKEAFSQANKSLRSLKGVELKMANKVYIPDHFHLNEQFADVYKEVFDAEVETIDFLESEKAANTINAWVEDHTNKRIKKLIDPGSCNSDTQAFLINAIYFKGSWKEKFNSKHTKERDFHVSKDKTVKIPFMYQVSHYLHVYSEELDANILQMPYEGDETNFLIILPTAIDGLSALEEKLRNPILLKDAISKMWLKKVHLYLPKFKIETTTNLKDALKGMNINKLFSPDEAKIDYLLKEENKLYVSEAKQKAFIEVNEEGAEAAAGNAFGFVSRSSSVEPTVTFDANHPFIFAIRSHDIALFTGRYIK